MYISIKLNAAHMQAHSSFHVYVSIEVCRLNILRAHERKICFLLLLSYNENVKFDG